MPNWCEGNIRIKGKQKDIKRFLMSEIVCCKYEKDFTTVELMPKVKDDDYSMTFEKPCESSWFYFRNTARNFIESELFEVWCEAENPEEEIIVCIDNFKAAWSFERCKAWKDFTKQYNIDVKMFGYDQGMMFSQIKTILRDGTEKEEVKEYASWQEWMWNCPQPNNGG